MNWDYNADEKPPPNWPGPLALLTLGLVLAVIILCVTGCRNTATTGNTLNLTVNILTP